MQRFFVLFILVLSLILSLPSLAFAQACPDTGCPAAGVLQVQELLSRIINISVGVGFMALTVWLVWAAVKLFITSGGDPKALAQAWQAVTWAFTGILFLALGWLVLVLIETFSGVKVTGFCIGFPGAPTNCNSLYTP